MYKLNLIILKDLIRMKEEGANKEVIKENQTIWIFDDEFNYGLPMDCKTMQLNQQLLEIEIDF